MVWQSGVPVGHHVGTEVRGAPSYSCGLFSQSLTYVQAGLSLVFSSELLSSLFLATKLHSDIDGAHSSACLGALCRVAILQASSGISLQQSAQDAAAKVAAAGKECVA